MSEKKLFLLDGHALIFRAHYAFINRPLINSKGMNTSAVTGFVRSLWDILQNQKPSHIAVSFDVSKKTFRNDMYPEYKANRDETPEDIRLAFPYVKRIVEGFNIPIVTLDNYEADDVIGTLAKQAEKEGFTVYMVTPDKDYAQLVSQNIKMWKPSRQGNGVEVLGEKEILEKWDIKRIDQVIDVLGLQGDAVDNIPGIPGIGPKTAVKLLNLYDTVEGIIAHVDELKGKQQENVRTYADQAILSKELATINTESPVQFHEESYRLEPLDHEKLSEVFKELEFRSLSTQILGGNEGAEGTQTVLFGEPVVSSPIGDRLQAHDIADQTIESVKHNYEIIDTATKINGLIATLKKEKRICFDTETTGLDVLDAELVGMSFAIKVHHAWYVPMPADQKEAQAIIETFRPIFEDPTKTFIAQNIKYDYNILRRYHVELAGQLEDTMILHYLIEPELRHNMDYLSESYLKYKPVSITTLIGKKGSTQLNMRDIDVKKVAEYAAEDADITLQLFEYIAPQVVEEGIRKVYDEIDGPLIRVLADMEHDGINLDEDYLYKYSDELGKLIIAQEKNIYKKAGSPFNISSPKQVGEILFERLKIPYRWRKTASGQYSTSEEKLAELEPHHDIIADILNYRMLTKLKSTYVDALPKMVHPDTGRIHSSFNQALAATGRLSSNNPNLQNIPIRRPEGRKVREAFIPADDNHILLAADYSQIELRLIAEISGDEAMLEAFIKNQDIHRATAAKVYDVPYEEVTDDQRRAAKTVNFSIIYGAGAQNLSRQLNIKRDEARHLIDQYFKQYSGLRNYMDKTVAYAREHGYVLTLQGRKRKLRDINSKNSLARSGAERIAINTPIQGTAADLIKLAMIDIHAYMKENKVKSKMILQVHDELVFDMHKDEIEDLSPIIEEKMAHAIPGLKVPIRVSMGRGKNWLEAH
jgi:DNA polymerase-1